MILPISAGREVRLFSPAPRYSSLDKHLKTLGRIVNVKYKYKYNVQSFHRDRQYFP